MKKDSEQFFENDFYQKKNLYSMVCWTNGLKNFENENNILRILIHII